MATLEISEVNMPQDNNVQLLQYKCSSSANYFSSYKIHIAQTIRNIVLGERLVVPYRNKYKLNKTKRLQQKLTIL